jgi:host factor-I protein
MYTEETMTKEVQKHTEDDFLNNLRTNKVHVSVFLVNGIRLQGVIGNYDKNTIMLESATKQIIYKHAISTIMASSDH